MYERRRRLHARVRHLRHDFQHKATTAIAKRYARMGVETLNISGIIRNRRLSRAIADAGMSSFISMLEYKSELYGAELVRIDRWYASSKICSGVKPPAASVKRQLESPGLPVRLEHISAD